MHAQRCEFRAAIDRAPPAGASVGPRGCPEHPTAAGRVAACLPCMPAPAACHLPHSLFHVTRMACRHDTGAIGSDVATRTGEGTRVRRAGSAAAPPALCSTAAPAATHASPGRRPRRLHSSKGLNSPLTACLHSTEGGRCIFNARRWGTQPPWAPPLLHSVRASPPATPCPPRCTQQH